MLELNNRGASQYGLCSSMGARCAPSTLCHSCNSGCHVPMQAAEGTPLTLKLTTHEMHRPLITWICWAMQAAKGTLSGWSTDFKLGTPPLAAWHAT